MTIAKTAAEAYQHAANIVNNYRCGSEVIDNCMLRLNELAMQAKNTEEPAPPLHPGKVYRHFKGKRYLVLGAALAIKSSYLAGNKRLYIGTATHSETQEQWLVYIEACINGSPKLGAVTTYDVKEVDRQLVLYVPLYEGAPPLMVRPLHMWHEFVQLPYQTTLARRFTLEEK